MSKQVVLEFPAELPEDSLRDSEVLNKGKAVIVLELLRKGTISQGKASELLEVDRHTLFDLMAKYDLPAIEMTDQELKEELSRPLAP